MMMALMMMIMMIRVIGVGDEDVDAGDNVHFKDYGGDGVNVGIDILSEKLAWRNASHVFLTAAMELQDDCDDFDVIIV